MERIRDGEAHEGARVLVEARPGNARVPLQIDVGLGDAIAQAPEELEFPTLLEKVVMVNSGWRLLKKLPTKLGSEIEIMQLEEK